jgi:hypothetical protein
MSAPYTMTFSTDRATFELTIHETAYYGKTSYGDLAIEFFVNDESLYARFIGSFTGAVRALILVAELLGLEEMINDESEGLHDDQLGGFACAQIA